MKKVVYTLAVLFVLGGLWIVKMTISNVEIVASTTYNPNQTIEDKIKEIRKTMKENTPLHIAYKDIPVIDVHSHDVSFLHTSEMRSQDPGSSHKEYWLKYGMDKTVLFGDVSEPSAVRTDELTWNYYKKYPTIIYPSFSGFPLNEEENGLEMVTEKLEKGYLNIGEIYAASTFSPSANVAWKGEHPYYGILPEVYDLAATYKVPVLLHIDPPKGTPILYFKKALKNHPNTVFIFAHGNVYNSPQQLKGLLGQFDNLYIDFFAGFTKYNQGSSYKLEDFVSLIEEYPDRFVLGSDSGIEVGLENSYRAMYELLHMLTPKTMQKVGYQNYERLIEEQPPTELQIRRIKELHKEKSFEDQTYRLNKRKANELIFSLEQDK
jgi:predicted TIM-barrel fold metal-dependent hydrolase